MNDWAMPAIIGVSFMAGHVLARGAEAKNQESVDHSNEIVA